MVAAAGSAASGGNVYDYQLRHVTTEAIIVAVKLNKARRGGNSLRQ